jgi:hypothetical protein
MPVDLLTNPAAYFGETYIGGGQVVEYYNNADTVPLTNGMLVSLIAIVAPSLGPATVKRSPTVADGAGPVRCHHHRGPLRQRRSNHRWHVR